MSVVLLSMQDQKALSFHQEYRNFFSEDERKSYGFGMTVNNDIFFIFGWTNPLIDPMKSDFRYVSLANLHLEGTLNI